jgi:hypothetical protein
MLALVRIDWWVPLFKLRGVVIRGRVHGTHEALFLAAASQHQHTGFQLR